MFSKVKLVWKIKIQSYFFGVLNLQGLITVEFKFIKIKSLKFHLEKPFRKLKFTTYIYKQKTINELCKKITGKNNINDPKRILVGFGNWSSQKDSIIRGHRGGPVVALKRELKRCCKLKLVDEYCTGKMCL